MRTSLSLESVSNQNLISPGLLITLIYAAMFPASTLLNLEQGVQMERKKPYKYSLDTENDCMPIFSTHETDQAGINKGINKNLDPFSESITSLKSLRSYQLPFKGKTYEIMEITPGPILATSRRLTPSSKMAARVIMADLCHPSSQTKGDYLVISVGCEEAPLTFEKQSAEATVSSQVEHCPNYHQKRRVRKREQTGETVTV